MAEKKYINSEKVIKLLRKELICKYPTTFAHGLWAAADEIAKMDGEDVRPVVRGEWKKRQNWSGCVCSVCSWESGNVYNFCPNCVADMRWES